MRGKKKSFLALSLSLARSLSPSIYSPANGLSGANQRENGPTAEFVPLRSDIGASQVGTCGRGSTRSRLRLFEQLSLVNDLQLIRPMCSAHGNVLHVATAWKNSLLWTGWWEGGVGWGWGSLCATLMGKDLRHQFVSGGEEGEGVALDQGAL